MALDENAVPEVTAVESSEVEGEATDTRSADHQRLHELGYAQELDRSMSGFSNFAVSFTIISILSACLTLYGFGMNTGGPSIIVWGWPFVGLMTLLVGLAMAEVCSSYPTAGGLSYWAAKLAPSNGPAWSWFTGWFGWVAIVWVAFISVLFMLPQVSPITRTTFNYTPVAVLVVLGFAGIWWLVSARRWFTGPKVQGTPEELAAIERDLESVG